jgi:hypothetical protein
VYKGARARAKTPSEVDSLRGHFSQRVRYLTRLVEKMTTEPHFLAFLRSSLDWDSRTSTRPAIPENGL